MRTWLLWLAACSHAAPVRAPIRAAAEPGVAAPLAVRQDRAVAAPVPDAPERCRDNDRIACIAAAQGRPDPEALGYLAKACDLAPRDWKAEQGWTLPWDEQGRYWQGCGLLTPLIQPAINAARARLGPGWHDVSVEVALSSPVMCGEPALGPFGSGGAMVTIAFEGCGPELAR